MSRYTQDQNDWGSGLLNDKGLTATETANAQSKTNGTHGKRYGPLGIAGVSGVVRKNGKEHEYVFELSGEEVLTENGVPVTRALKVELTNGVGLLLNDITVIVHEAFEAGSTGIVNLSAQAATGGVFVDGVVASGIPLDAVGVVKLATLIAGPYSVDVDGNIQVFEEGGSLDFDFTGVIAGGGKAEIIMNYVSL